jgi:hypothetical protein
MVTDPAPDWVSPYWVSQAIPNKPAMTAVTGIYILNPGMAAAEVTVTFHHGDAAVYATFTQAIDARSVTEFAAIPESDQELKMGWVSIVSDQPVLPSGSIRTGGEEPGATEVPMTFGRWDWTQIKPPHFQPI